MNSQDSTIDSSFLVYSDILPMSLNIHSEDIARKMVLEALTIDSGEIMFGSPNKPRQLLGNMHSWAIRFALSVYKQAQLKLNDYLSDGKAPELEGQLQEDLQRCHSTLEGMVESSSKMVQFAPREEGRIRSSSLERQSNRQENFYLQPFPQVKQGGFYSELKFTQNESDLRKREHEDCRQERSSEREIVRAIEDWSQERKREHEDWSQERKREHEDWCQERSQEREIVRAMLEESREERKESREERKRFIAMLQQSQVELKDLKVLPKKRSSSTSMIVRKNQGSAPIQPSSSKGFRSIVKSSVPYSIGRPSKSTQAKKKYKK